MHYGDLATWLTGGVIFLGLLVERIQRRSDITRLDEQRDEDTQRSRYLNAIWQAQQIAGHIDWADSHGGLRLTLYNTSNLPVRELRISLYRKGTMDLVDRFPTKPVLAPTTNGPALDLKQITGWHQDIQLELELEFHDDTSVRWRKYRENYIECLTDPSVKPPWAGQYGGRLHRTPFW